MARPEPVLHAIGNAHIDPVWLWRWPEGLETIRATFRSALDRMSEYPDFAFCGSSAAFYALLEEADPAMLAEIVERVREGRWEIVGGWWVQPDANIPCGESLVRQALYGQRWFQRVFGVMATVGYNPDTFGHPGTLPQLLGGAGLTRYVFMRPGPHEKEIPSSVFRWRSPDGSEVMAARIARAYCSWGEDLREHVALSHAERPGERAPYIVFYGVGNHGGGPTRANIDSLHAMAAEPDTPTVRLSTLDAFFEEVDADIAAGAETPVVTDDLQHHARGCYTAHSEVKRQNRRVEHLLMTAEKVAAAAWMELGRSYPRVEMEAAWRCLLFNQFHDILAGTSLPEAYEDARDAFGAAATTAGRVLHTALQGLTAGIDTRGEGSALVVFNPLPWPLTAPVEIERGAASIADEEGRPVCAQAVQPTTIAGQRRSCFVAELPAMGYRLFREIPGMEVGAPSRSLCVSESGIENDWWTLRLDPETGGIASLLDRVSGVEVLAGPAGVGVVLEDRSDTWSHAVASFREEAGRLGGARVVVEEDGPVRACLRVRSAWGASTIEQRLFLYREVDVIECRVTVDWRERLRMLKLAFPLAIEEAEATWDVPYGCIARAATGEEQPGQQWLDVTGWARTETGERVRYGATLLNDGKYGSDVLGAEMRLSALRSPAYAHHDPNRLDPARGYAWIDQGTQTLTWRLVPHAGPWQAAAVARRAHELNVRPLWVNEYAHDGPLPARASFLEASPDNVVLTVCKPAEDGEAVIVRGYEAAGRQTEARLRLPRAGLEWRARFGAHQVRSWRVTPGVGPVEVDLLERPAAP